MGVMVDVYCASYVAPSEAVILDIGDQSYCGGASPAPVSYQRAEFFLGFTRPLLGPVRHLLVHLDNRDHHIASSPVDLCSALARAISAHGRHSSGLKA